tara:strand:- start:2287 stop:2688 length:402 start_codon:yes stop_codon:yes gene_type:complete
MQKKIPNSNPRILIIQNLYSKYVNKDNIIEFKKHRFKKFIKDVVNGTIERNELIEELITKHLKEDINLNRTDKILIVTLHASIYEFLYKPQTSLNIIINEYLDAAKYFIEDNQKKFLNALLDKIGKKIRFNNE